jgi:hypothetical protein
VTELLEHLDRQVRSSQRLLGIVIDQGKAIRGRDVEGVLLKLSELQAEMVQRTQLEAERDALIARAAEEIGCRPDEIDLEAMLERALPGDAAQARALSAELRGLITETSRVHEQNRVLLRQELSFLDHLMRMLTGTPQGAYTPGGLGRAPQLSNAVNARA